MIQHVQYVRSCLQQAQHRGLDRLDAQLLLLHCLGKPGTDRAWLMAHDDAAVAAKAAAQFLQYVNRRTQGEPLAYLTGHKEFFGLDLQVDARVLVPRPDTETLVEWAIEIASTNPRGPGSTSPAPLRIADLGTGSGAIALALKHALPAAQVWATDFSLSALEVAVANARRLNLAVQFAHGSWLEALLPENQKKQKNEQKMGFDLIVSNPPYIAQGDAHLPALVHEPISALTSGADGLDAIRHIVVQAPTQLKPSGWLLLEHGYDQADRVAELLTAAGFTNVGSRRDLGAHLRCTGGQRAI